ncbi:MAG: hypothetical protein KatS3mg051_1449 [Anaerolineae bacterium]|nr:MAG: hypothetical protein KatS3mg051_1449 [Anaerolineae bacterium]
MAFQVAQGHDNVAGLVDVVVEPRHSGILYPRVIIAASGQKYYDGQPYAEWRWDYLRKATYQDLLTQLGLSDAVISAPVTVRLLKNDFTTWANYNATAFLPDMGTQIEYRLGKFLNIVVVLRGLQEIT